MELGISGRTALVTGGPSGIGPTIVIDLAKEKVPVVFKSRNRKRGEQLLREILEIIKWHKFFSIDVSSESGPRFLFDEPSKSVLPSIWLIILETPLE